MPSRWGSSSAHRASKQLEHGGLIDRVVEPTVPVLVRYRLSPRGRDLLASLQPLQEYGRRWEPRA
jgi:DNA-binding HxlR family transcriptional regulator